MRWLFFTPLVFLFYAIICFYIGKRLFILVKYFLPGMKPLVYWLVFSLLCCLLVFSNFLRHNLYFLRQAGLIWMVVLMYMLLLLVLSDFSRLVLFLFGKQFRNFQIYSTGAAVLLCAILIVFGVFQARFVKTVNYTLTLPSPPSGSFQSSDNGIRIALVSDLHIGRTIGEKWIEKIVDVINKAEPDIVCLAGDIFDGNISGIKDLPGVVSQLKRINASLGVYACLGNHDIDRMSFTGAGTERVEAILKQAGIILLQDDVYTIREGLFIAGRKDARPIGMKADRKTAEELLAGLNGVIIVLDHQPTQFPQLELAGADLVLSGHTHKGQVFPGNLITRSMFKRLGATHYGYWQGETVSETRMQGVVTSGSAYWGPPVRVGTNSEVAVIDLEFMGITLTTD